MNIQRLKSWQVLFLLALLAAFIRFYRLEYSSLWLDEIYSMLGASPSKSFFEVYEYGKNDQPPLFFVVLHYWLKLFGFTDFAGRSLSCLFGVGGVIAIYFLGKEVKNEKVGLLAAFITSINWFHVFYSKEIRFYALVFLLSSLSFLFLIRSIKNEKTSNFILYSLSTALLLNTHYYAMAVFISQIVIFIIVLVYFKFSKRLLYGGLFAGAIAGLAFAHWLPVIFSELGVSRHYLTPLKWDFLFDLYWSYIKEPTQFAVYTFCIALAIVNFYKRKERADYIHYVFIFWILISLGLPIIYSFTRVQILTSKYTSTIVPAVLVIIAYGFTLIKREKIFRVMIGMVSIGAIVILFYARPPFSPRRDEDWREVANYFQHHQNEKQVIFTNLNWFHQYYFNKLNLPLPVFQGEVDFQTLVNECNSVWILYHDFYAPKEAYDFSSSERELIQSDFVKSDSVKFKRTTAINYLRNNSRPRSSTK